MPGLTAGITQTGSPAAVAGSVLPAQNIDTNTFRALPGGSSLNVSQQGYAFPTLAGTLAGSGAANTQQASASLMELLGNPTANSAYKTTLSGMLSDLQPSIQEGYSNLSDAFRKAGAQQSGAYGDALSKYATGVERNQAGAAADALKAVLPSLVQGYSGLATQTPSLLDALKTQNSYGVSQAAGSGASAGLSSGGQQQRQPQWSGFSPGNIGVRPTY